MSKFLLESLVISFNSRSLTPPNGLIIETWTGGFSDSFRREEGSECLGSKVEFNSRMREVSSCPEVPGLKPCRLLEKGVWR